MPESETSPPADPESEVKIPVIVFSFIAIKSGVQINIIETFSFLLNYQANPIASIGPGIMLNIIKVPQIYKAYSLQYKIQYTNIGKIIMFSSQIVQFH